MISSLSFLAVSPNDALTLGTGWIAAIFGLLTAFCTALGIFWAKFGTQLTAMKHDLFDVKTRLNQHRQELTTLNLAASPTLAAGAVGATETTTALEANTQATKENTDAQLAGSAPKTSLADQP